MVMNDTRLSIIIPLFNGKAYIDDTVTALRQIHSFKEILIVDDESTDGSYEYCKNRWSGCSDIRVLHQEHGGITKARNHGLREAVENGSCFQIKMMLLSRKRLMRQFSGRNGKNWMEFYGRPSICMKMAESSHVILFFNKKFLQDLWFKLNYYVIC